ncbi:MAG TPA: hypothetical protein VFQ58_01300 [Flavisolibacter sp.]|jgi:hypothetical protein|nr:hypothetical protein [Flavisolibacter sp.]
MKEKNLSDRDVFVQYILPQLKKDFPDSSIMEFVKEGDEYKVGIYIEADNKKSRIIQRWMIVREQAIFISSN